MRLSYRIRSLERAASDAITGECDCKGGGHGYQLIWLRDPNAVLPPPPHCIRCRRTIRRITVTVRPAPWADPNKPIPPPGYIACSGLREFYVRTAFEDPEPDWWRSRGGTEGHIL